MLMFIPPERARFFTEQPPALEQAIRDKFPELTADICDANRCFCVGCPTAAVYHLMRVVEFGVRKLAKRLKLPKGLEHKPWGPIFQAANDAIGALAYTSANKGIGVTGTPRPWPI